MKTLFMLALIHSCLWAAQTTALFQPASTSVGPFPSNALTVTDDRQETGLDVNLPDSANACDPASSPSVCSNTALLNQLDGFSVNPRIMVCFSAAVNPNTLKSGIGLLPAAGGSAVRMNQIIFDPVSNCAFAKPNQVLVQDTEYLLVETNSVHDSTGAMVTRDDRFEACLKSSDAYCAALSQALESVGQQPASANIVAASLFTTMSATSWQEKAQQFVDANEPPTLLTAGPPGAPSTFALQDLASMTWQPDNSGLGPQPIPLDVLQGVDQVAFGLYLSPNFLDPANGTIPTTPTNDPISGPIPIPGVSATGFLPVSFHVFLPPNPYGGKIPVVIYGHGLSDNQFGAPTYIASTLARNGFATLAIEITGHGYGPGSSVVLTDKNGASYTVSTPGRGIQLSAGAPIGPTSGCIVPGAIAVRDCGRQTAIDLFALVKTIQETNGLSLNLDPNRIYFVGQSFGAIYGTLFQAVEPAVNTAVMSGAGGPSVSIARLSISGRPIAEEFLGGVNPGLLNVSRGIAPPENYFHDSFNDNYVFRDMPPVVNNVRGAMAIQAAFEAAEWLGMLGDALSYASGLDTPLTALVPGKHTLFLFGYGDLEVPNPTESALIRAAKAQPSSWFFRFDLATQPSQHPELLGITSPGVPFPILPHRILSNPTIFDRTADPLGAEQSIALAEQQQVATYFTFYGYLNVDPNIFLTPPFFLETIFQDPPALPERLNFLQIKP